MSITIIGESPKNIEKKSSTCQTWNAIESTKAPSAGWPFAKTERSLESKCPFNFCLNFWLLLTVSLLNATYVCFYYTSSVLVKCVFFISDWIFVDTVVVVDTRVNSSLSVAFFCRRYVIDSVHFCDALSASHSVAKILPSSANLDESRQRLWLWWRSRYWPLDPSTLTRFHCWKGGTGWLMRKTGIKRPKVRIP